MKRWRRKQNRLEAGDIAILWIAKLIIWKRIYAKICSFMFMNMETGIMWITLGRHTTQIFHKLSLLFQQWFIYFLSDAAYIS